MQHNQILGGKNLVSLKSRPVFGSSSPAPLYLAPSEKINSANVVPSTKKKDCTLCVTFPEKYWRCNSGKKYSFDHQKLVFLSAQKDFRLKYSTMSLGSVWICLYLEIYIQRLEKSWYSLCLSNRQQFHIWMFFSVAACRRFKALKYVSV